jgi:hypothetical protein
MLNEGKHLSDYSSVVVGTTAGYKASSAVPACRRQGLPFVLFACLL